MALFPHEVPVSGPGIRATNLRLWGGAGAELSGAWPQTQGSFQLPSVSWARKVSQPTSHLLPSERVVGGARVRNPMLADV